LPMTNTELMLTPALAARLATLAISPGLSIRSTRTTSVSSKSKVALDKAFLVDYSSSVITFTVGLGPILSVAKPLMLMAL